VGVGILVVGGVRVGGLAERKLWSSVFLSLLSVRDGGMERVWAYWYIGHFYRWESLYLPKGCQRDSCLLSGYFLVSLQAVAVWKVANTTNNLQFISARDLVF
jgi:hypothetical protein